ncbi:MAG: ubiquinol--cytochrome-c reductase subunit 8 [Ramalina farinacea]|uniref:Cytochrome b-c1 complex subunit 8 n=1 Tax=Ramalina farinacea TaxID=258253 RepID=A0AA43QL96_9LECA|nr:ubiquinol--cytochrome-c reductase subunit 8 [Ramalina farinacea]
MRPTFPRLSGGSQPLDTKHGQFIGGWGNLGSQPQKGITSYALSANRQRPLAGTANAAVFNVWRRFRAQALYFIPPLLIAYTTMNWAIEKNEYYNSKHGRAEAEEKDALGGGSVRA